MPTQTAKIDNSKNVLCPRLRITYTVKKEDTPIISVKHLTDDYVAISECIFSPEEAYEYAKAILDAYDTVIELE